MKPTNSLLFTGDSSYLFCDRPPYDPDMPFSADRIHEHIRELASFGVDTYLCSPQGQANWWPSRRVPNLFQGYTRGDRDFVMTHAKCSFWNLKAVDPQRLEQWADSQVAFLNRYLDLQEAGIDWVAECAAACRKNGITPWLTIRMNDTHGRVIEGNDPEPDSYFNAPLFKNPENRLSGQSILGRKGEPAPRICSTFIAMNYARDEVRSYMLDTIRELVEDYDFEGLQLDWTRGPKCMEPDASEESIELMNAFHAEVRAMTEQKARQMGRPYPMGLRLQPSFDMLRCIGLDVPEITRRGLVDFLCPNNGWLCSWEMPHEELRREFGEEVRIYGSLEKGANGLICEGSTDTTYGCRLLPQSVELVRGNAAGKLALGAEGMEVFNFFVGDDQLGELSDLDDLENLRGKPKQYLLSSVPGGLAYPFDLPHQLPVVLEPAWRKHFRIPMCSEPEGADLELVVQLVVEGNEDTTVPGLRFNQLWPRYDATRTDELLFAVGTFTRHADKHQALNYILPVSAIREGWNEIELFHPHTPPRPHEPQHDQRVYVLSIELGIR